MTPPPTPTQGMASMDPRGLIGRINVEDHKTLLHMKYISFGPHGLREEDFLSFSHYKSLGANDPQGTANLDPGAWLAGFM